MKGALRICLCIILLTAYKKNDLASILFDKKNAVVWLQKQTISGKVSGFHAKQLTVRHDDTLFYTSINKDSTFAFAIKLHEAENKIWLTAGKGTGLIVSDTLRLTLGYHPLPVVKPYAIITGNKATLYTTIIENPASKPLQYLWTADAQNPAVCNIINNDSSTATADIPIAEGMYRFNVQIIGGNDSTWFQTCVIRKKKTLQAFDITAEHAAWINDAVIYQVTPTHFVKNAGYDDITAKLPELKMLGINTLWLQPVLKTQHGGQGYDIIDYFSLRSDLGNEQQLKHLISVAKSLQMRVLFDFIPNHTSIFHPYAQDYIKYGKASHYYDFYQHENDGVKYSSHYNKDSNGFVYYFWKDLVNLNYNNAEVQQWMIEACKYWIRKLDIDGYRFDAIWGVNARAPAFGKRLQTELKSIKPDLFLLAEDKPGKEVYAAGFDAAYDWTADTNWVSQWCWQQNYDSNTTIFNFKDVNKRGDMLREALFNNKNSDKPVLRFIENNDLPRFVRTHNLKQVKMAAALLFSLNGIPMIYNGQETGFPAHPYTSKPMFVANKSIQTLDSNHLFSHYKKLIHLRLQYAALRGPAMEEVPVSPRNAMVAFHRWKDKEHFIILVNLDSAAAETTINVSKLFEKNSSQKYLLKDVLSNDLFKSDMEKQDIKIPMEGYSTRWLLLQ